MVHYSYQKRTTKTSETVFYANSANNNFIKHLHRVHINKKIKQVTC